MLLHKLIKTYFLSWLSQIHFWCVVFEKEFRFSFGKVFALLLFFGKLPLLLLFLQRLFNLLFCLNNFFFVDQIQDFIQLLLIKLDIFFSDCFNDLKLENQLMVWDKN